MQGKWSAFNLACDNLGLIQYFPPKLLNAEKCGFPRKNIINDTAKVHCLVVQLQSRLSNLGLVKNGRKMCTLKEYKLTLTITGIPKKTLLSLCSISVGLVRYFKVCVSMSFNMCVCLCIFQI